MNAPTIELLNQTQHEDCPSLKQFQSWIDAACAHKTMPSLIKRSSRSYVTLVIIDSDEMQSLNFEFRHKNYPTNVLSFPDETLPNEKPDSCGDIVFCYETILSEAKTLSIPWLNHFAHLTIHGLLHLLGYDHVDDQEATRMESLEIEILQSLNIPNPY